MPPMLARFTANLNRIIKPNRDLFYNWVFVMIALAFMMIAVGGLTRLYEAGLSMVDWRLLGGVLPPLTPDAWLAEFARYQAYPQYQQVMTGLSLSQFKWLFFWEWFHRILGRVVGLVALWGALAFGFRGRPVAIIIALWVIMQGLFGWIMVQTGLKQTPTVDAIALTSHLSLASSLILICITSLKSVLTPIIATQYWRVSMWVLFSAIAAQVILGGLVAGWDAGIGYNTFPLMNGQWLPANLDTEFFIQFIHRSSGVLIGLSAVVMGLVCPRDQALWPWLIGILGLILTQIGLGIATLVYVVPIHLASLHQLVGILTLAVTYKLAIRLKPA